MNNKMEMETLYTRVSNALNKAIKEQNTVQKDTLRGIKSAFDLLAKNGNKPPTEDDYIKSLEKMVKQRLESYEIFSKQNRTDLADNEKSQLDIIKTYLPAELSEEDLTKIVSETFRENNLETITRNEFGQIMGQIKNKIKGKVVNNKLLVDIINKRVV